MDETDRIIDIEKTLRNSKSAFIRSLPKFIIVLIANIVKQDEINAVIYNNRDKEGVPFINGILKDWNVKIIVEGEENIPVSGRYIFAANHPVGGMDAKCRSVQQVGLFGSGSGGDHATGFSKPEETVETQVGFQRAEE